jgi:hypothetical protein
LSDTTEKLIQLIRKKWNVSFVEIERFLNAQGIPTEGNESYLLKLWLEFIWFDIVSSLRWKFYRARQALKRMTNG